MIELLIKQAREMPPGISLAFGLSARKNVPPPSRAMQEVWRREKSRLTLRSR